MSILLYRPPLCFFLIHSFMLHRRSGSEDLPSLFSFLLPSPPPHHPIIHIHIRTPTSCTYITQRKVYYTILSPSPSPTHPPPCSSIANLSLIHPSIHPPIHPSTHPPPLPPPFSFLPSRPKRLKRKKKEKKSPHLSLSSNKNVPHFTINQSINQSSLPDFLLIFFF